MLLRPIFAEIGYFQNTILEYFDGTFDDLFHKSENKAYTLFFDLALTFTTIRTLIDTSLLPTHTVKMWFFLSSPIISYYLSRLLTSLCKKVHYQKKTFEFQIFACKRGNFLWDPDFFLGSRTYHPVFPELLSCSKI